MSKKKILMLDIETLGTRSNAVAWQIAMVGVLADDPEEMLDPPVNSFLPIQPQLNLIPPRVIDASTLIYWMGQSAEARDGFKNCESTDFEELPSLIRHWIRAFNRMTDNGRDDYEIVTRGNFDLPIVQSLIEQLGLEIPWDFRKTTDLRTLMRYAGLEVKDVPEPAGFIKHNAYWDCRFQLACYFEAIKLLSGGKA